MLSPSDSSSEMRTKIKKRKYSRNGCVECKRRKIKCDEGDPECFNCTRLKKKCFYPGDKKRHSEAHDASDKSEKSSQDGSLFMKFYEPKKELQSKSRQSPVERDWHAESAAASTQVEASNGVAHEGSFGASLSDESPSSIKEPFGLKENELLRHTLLTEMRSFQDDVSVFLSEFNPRVDLDNSDAITDFVRLEADGGNSTTLAPQTSKAAGKCRVQNNSHGHDKNSESRLEPGISASAELQFSADIAELIENHDIHEIAAQSRNASHLIHLSNNELLEQCIESNSLKEPHVYYLRLLSTTEMSYHFFPFAPQVESNGVVKLLLIYAVKCPYLLMSMLAISATFEFIRTGDKRHDSARSFYSDLCFKVLSDAFQIHFRIDETGSLVSSFESLLLTVLVLSSNFTATASLESDTKPSSWKDHLKGARDLLLSFSKMTKDLPNQMQPFMSIGFSLAKCWFFAIETSAAIHTSVGGALSKTMCRNIVHQPYDNSDVYSRFPDVQLDKEYKMFADTGYIEQRKYPEYHDALSQVNLICPMAIGGDFNMFWGYGETFPRIALAFVSVTDAIKIRGLYNVPFQWTMHLISLLDDFAAERVVPDICPFTFKIPRTSPGHPEYSGTNKKSYPESCYFATLDDNGETQYYSWFDASHQLHANYFSMRILVSSNFFGLPRSHPDIQYMVNRFFKGLFFIKSKDSIEYEKERNDILTESTNYYLSSSSFDIRCVMVQSVFRLLTGVVINDDEFERIELFFSGLLKLGNGSSLSSLDMVTRVKMRRASNKERLNGEVDEEIYDFYDSMSDIPFA